ncbi:MAG: Mth938-like domain-containing protein [Burkholderiales bacterium]|nr:Mth938-like domain-containing protein [Burkholderiales bacterium]
MKLHLAAAPGLQLVTGYGAAHVAVNNVRYERSVLVSPDGVAEWRVGAFETLTEQDFAFIAARGAEVVLLGTGRTQRFPPPPLAHALALSGAGVEIMDSMAACRTYNILAAEGRRVVAAILVEP